jgi:putative ATP-binding cassette transporter
LNFTQQQYEADFRFNLVRVRENAEQVALLAGEPAERRRLLDRFANVVHNWHAIMSRQKKIRAFTAGYEQVSTIFPFVVVSPAYFAGTIQLGGLMQTASAFGSVQGAFSFFVSTYRQIADWRAVVERLDGFERTVALASRAAVNPPVISVGASDNANSVILDGLDLRLPDDRPLLTAARLEVKPGEHVLVNGPSGSGKSTLFRAIAGIWPFGTGSITMPKGASIMVLPQQPYLPIGTLKAAVVYPALPDSFDSDLVREALQAVGLAALAGRLDDAEHWNRMLSPGEQQRLGLARALLHAPDYLFLDEATASLDEPTEAELYKLVERRLPNATIVSIGHRSTLNAFHTRFVRLERAGDRSVLQPQLPAAAS